MLRRRRLARVISDMGFGELRRQLAYKVEVPGSALMVADRWFPSSRLCRACDTVHPGLGLGDRVFRCDGCGHVEDRDPVSGTGQALHASRNLERYPGRRGNLHACGHRGSGQAGQLTGETRMDEAGILHTHEHF